MKTIFCIFTLSLFLSTSLSTYAGLKDFATLQNQFENDRNIVVDQLVDGMLNIIDTKIDEEVKKRGTPKYLEVAIPVIEFDNFLKLDEDTNAPYMNNSFVKVEETGIKVERIKKSTIYTQFDYEKLPIHFKMYKIEEDGSITILPPGYPKLNFTRNKLIISGLSLINTLNDDLKIELRKEYNIEEIGNVNGPLMRLTQKDKDKKTAHNISIIKVLNQRLAEKGYELFLTKTCYRHVNVISVERIFKLRSEFDRDLTNYSNVSVFSVPIKPVITEITIKPIPAAE